ncbi:hypothetical protein PIB30_094068 [Stylosanthes scabra]|uniref:Uncharacterized protein n=1 Tax=Stylosanthes scabra TaxID=79078 RepID=A0ABU6SWH0_9FABA|nr:hypothetical protein [Stylosanthes scabra]
MGAAGIHVACTTFHVVSVTIEISKVACTTYNVAHATSTLAASMVFRPQELRVQLPLLRAELTPQPPIHMASKGKAPARAPPTRARVDKKGKKVVQTPPTRASARLAALKTRTSPPPPPASSTPAMSQPAVNKPIFIDLTKDSAMIGLRELDSSDSDLGLPSSPSSSSKEDDVLGNDPGFWDYDDLDDWGTAEPAASFEASCTSHPPPNR